MSEKKVSKAAVGKVVSAYLKVLDDEADISQRKSDCARELHEMIGSNPIVVKGEKMRAIKRVKKDKETGEDLEPQYFIRGQKPVEAEFSF